MLMCGVGASFFMFYRKISAKKLKIMAFAVRNVAFAAVLCYYKNKNEI